LLQVVEVEVATMLVVVELAALGLALGFQLLLELI
tara:strand:- start:557 stop:661 length:105 start_codon:yes stop_codon:yes gene_type:complete